MKKFYLLVIALCTAITLYYYYPKNTVTVDTNDLPVYSGEPYIEMGTPNLKLQTKPYLQFSKLDELGRCGKAKACLSVETLPTEERGYIGMIKPSGWHTVRYDVIEDRYLYNRCHLIAYSLSGENANERNLITGTRYMNKEGMLPIELKVLHYLYDTHNHVVYQVTPVFIDDELVCRGVWIETMSVEDNDLRLKVYCFNVQPGISIEYSTGESKLS